MPFKFFIIPVHDPQAAERELNAFLRAQKVQSVEHRWVDQGGSSFWAVSIAYLDGPARPDTREPKSGQRARVDYQQVLSPEDFAIYLQLRDWRAELAEADKVPVYQVFNNQQLATIIEKRLLTKDALASLPGVGQARIEKYGDRVLEQFKQVLDGRDEKNGKSV